MIKIKAFSDLILKISTIIFEIISKPNISKDKFTTLIEKLKEIKSALDYSRPYEIAIKHFSRIMKENNKFPYGDISEEYGKVIENLSTFSKHFIIDALFTGYITEKAAKDIYEKSIIGVIDNSSTKIQQELKVSNSKEAINYLNAHYLLKGSYVFRQKTNIATEENHAIVNYYYVGNYHNSYDQVIKANMLMLSWGNIFFEKLRTEQQLGYIVNSRLVDYNHNYYYEIIIQGDKKNPKDMNILLDQVIDQIKVNIKEYDAKFIEELRVNSKILPFMTLNVKSDFIFNNILNQETKLDRYDVDSMVKNVGLTELSQMLDDIFYINPKKLSIQIFNKNTVTLPLEAEKYNLNQNIQSVVSDNLDFVKDKQ